MDHVNIGSMVPRQRGVRDHARSEVLHRHAKLMRNGRPVFCTPSTAELSGRVAPKQSRGTDGKVIYPTREAAEAAARELEALGARSLRSYVCGRSRRGHFHLTTDTAHRTGRVAPQPRVSPDPLVGDLAPVADAAPVADVAPTADLAPVADVAPVADAVADATTPLPATPPVVPAQGGEAHDAGEPSSVGSEVGGVQDADTGSPVAAEHAGDADPRGNAVVRIPRPNRPVGAVGPVNPVAALPLHLRIPRQAGPRAS